MVVISSSGDLSKPGMIPKHLVCFLHWHAASTTEPPGNPMNPMWKILFNILLI